MAREEIFKGVKVVEFAAFAAGPVIGKHVGEHGGTVIHVESMSRPDGFRTHYPPYLDNKPGLNRSGCFDICNNSKLSVTIDLKAKGGLDAAKKLIAWADVVIENFTPGTMKRLGLGYEELCQVREDIIMLSTCNQGQSGPHAQHPGFGSHLSSLSGFTHFTGFPGEIPSIPFGPYIDFIGVGFGMVALSAALDYRRRTGKGQYIDIAQYEGGVHFIAPALLDYEVNGRTMERMGNRHSAACPHGVYPTQGEDRWCALSVHNDAQWAALRRLLRDQSWANDEKFGTVLGRKANEDELDRLLASWTATQEREDLMNRLQAAGVPAGAVNRMGDLYSDPQLKARKHWWELDHAELGVHHYESAPVAFSKTPIQMKRPAPCLGEDNEYIFKTLLGVGDEEYAALLESGVVDAAKGFRDEE